jgi:hypothetical protein
MNTDIPLMHFLVVCKKRCIYRPYTSIPAKSPLKTKKISIYGGMLGVVR